MINARVQNIIDVANKFTGTDGEPCEGTEFYILKSMWVMMLSELEGSIKELAEFYIDEVKKSEIHKINICLLLQNFYPNSEENLTINKVISVYKKNPKDIDYRNFTRNYKPKYKSQAVEKLFNTLGIFFSEEEITSLKMLDGIASTRDSIAHGDNQIQITKKELEERLLEIKNTYNMLKNKLDSNLLMIG